jgi:UDPglucose 6-dehydrogenase
MKIAIFGLGKVGAPMAAVFASSGAFVTGCDLKPEVAALVDRGVAPVEEPELTALMAENRDRLRGTIDAEKAVLASDISFVIVPTPSSADGTFNNRFVVEAVERIGRALRRKKDYHVVVVSSTVMPGSCAGPIKSTLEAASGRSVGAEIGLCYCPKFIALGSVIHDLTHPDFVLMGTSDARAAATAAEVYRRSCLNRPQIVQMSLVDAEIAKLSVNAFVTMKISFANLLGEVCEATDGADATAIASAIGLDKRIGAKCLQPALGFGGPCFPRDNTAFAAMARRVGVDADLAAATQRVNDHQIERISGLVAVRLWPDAKVAVLGLTYKPNTSVVERSQGIEIARYLAMRGMRVVVHDPIGVEAARALLGRIVGYAETAAAAVAEADAILVATPWPEYRDLQDIIRGRTVTIVDCWRLLDRLGCEAAGADLVQVGRSPLAGAEAVPAAPLRRVSS